MNPFEMVVLIVAIVMIASVFKSKYRSVHMRRDADGDQLIVGRGDAQLRTENEAMARDLKALKERVATLERIATDSSAALDREIEQLRRD